jgi:hypothetical protein
MLAIIISILDKLIKLKEYRDQRVQKVFQQVLEPIFNDLLSVHRDYIKMFEKAKTMLPTPDLSWKEFHRGLSEAADFLKEKRVEFEPARIKLKLMLGEIIGDTEASSHKVSFGAQADSFIDNVASYFQSEKGMAYVLTTRYELPLKRLKN